MYGNHGYGESEYCGIKILGIVVDKTLVVVYAIRNVMAKALVIKYNLRSLVQKTLTIVYGMGGPVRKTLTILYKIIAWKTQNTSVRSFTEQAPSNRVYTEQDKGSETWH